MSLIFFLFKIIGYSLLGILGILCLVISIIMFLPIDYRVYYKKSSNDTIDVNIKFFHMIGIRYDRKDETNEVVISLWGITLKRIPLDENEKPVEETPPKVNLPVAQKEPENTTYTAEKMPKVEDELKENKVPKEEKQAESLKQKDNTSNKTLSSEKQKTKMQTNNKDKTKDKPKSKDKKQKADNGSTIDMLKDLWSSPYRNGLFQAVWRLLKQFFNEIKPKTFRFKAIIGKENPADTGELIAKLTMIYPLMYKYGVIEGNFTEKGLWGEVLVAGRIRLCNIVAMLIRFILDKEVRNYIKIMRT